MCTPFSRCEQREAPYPNACWNLGVYIRCSDGCQRKLTHTHCTCRLRRCCRRHYDATRVGMVEYFDSDMQPYVPDDSGRVPYRTSVTVTCSQGYRPRPWGCDLCAYDDDGLLCLSADLCSAHMPKHTCFICLCHYLVVKYLWACTPFKHTRVRAPNCI